MERSVLARRIAPFAVFAAVLAGIVAVSTRGGGGPAGGGGRLDPIPLSAGVRAGAASGEGAPRDAQSSDRMAYYGGEIVIPDRLLAGLPTEGPVLTVGRADPEEAYVLKLARALGVAGEVRSDDQGWVVGDDERALRVLRYAGKPWYLGPDKVAVGRAEDGGPVAVATPETATAEPAPSPAPSGGDTPVSSGTEPACEPDAKCVDPQPVDCPPPPDGAEPACVQPPPVPEPTKPPQPTDDEARAAARPVLDTLGLSDAPVTVNDGWTGKEVVASPVVAGLPTAGFETRVTVVKDGSIAYASGFLGATEAKDDYPLLAPRDAVERGGAWGPRIMADSIGAPCPPEEPCPTPAPREATAIRLGLVFMTSYDESQSAYLAPAWLLSFEGSTWEEPVLALPDQYIATPPPATDVPVDDGKTDPGVPGSEPGSDGSSGSGGGSEPNTGAPEQK